MNTQGPYLIQSHLQYDLSFPVNNLQIPVLVGRNGLVEIINASGYFLNVAFQSKGAVTQEPFSKVCYKIVQDIQGTQIVTVTANTNPPTQVNLLNALYIAPPRQAGQEYFWINVYEEGEIEWYPPLSIQPPPGQTHYTVHGAASGGYVVTVPTTQTWYNDATNPICYLTGIDIAGTNATTIASGSLVVSGLIQQADGSSTLAWAITAPADQGFFWPIRFPSPISNFRSGSAITISVPSLGSSFVTLDAYYYLD